MSMMWVGIGSAVVGAGTSIYGASQAGKQGAAPPPRDLNSELGTIANQVPTFAQLGFNNQANYNGQLTDLNQNNFNRAMNGTFDARAFEGAYPGFMQYMSDGAASGELAGWTPLQMAAAYSGKASENDPSLKQFFAGGLARQARDSFNQANAPLVNYTAGLQGTMDKLNANAPGPIAAASYNPSGYFATGSGNTSAGPAAQAQIGPFGPTNYGANLQAPQNIAGPQDARDVTATMVHPDTGYDRVNGNLGFDRVQAQTGFDRIRAKQGDIGLASATQRMLTGGPSDIQQSLEQQARSDLALGGSLSGEQVRNSQQAAREAGAARGLINSNSTVAAEILNRDAASSARLNERRGFAAAVDQKGFGERQQGFANALGVSNAFQNYGAQSLQAQQANLGAQLTGNAQNLQASMANQGARAQSNALNFQGQVANQGARAQSNALGLQGQLANASNSLAAQQANQGRDLTLNNQRFQTAQANQNAALTNNQLGLGYSQLNNNAFQSNADRQQQGNQYNAGQNNAMSQFNANLGQQNNQFNSAATNATAQFNAGASNAANQYNAGVANNVAQFNAGLQAQNNNDAWSRAMGYGAFQGQQAINPLQYYGLIQGQAPDYTNALLGYGSDLNNTNYNGQAAANISQRNNSTALIGSGLGLVGNAANMYGNYAGAQAGRPGGGYNPSGSLGTANLGMGGFSPVCWVARSVYGVNNPQWVRFRHWLLNFAPRWFKAAYIKHGEKFAAWLDKNAWAKPPIKAWMDSRIATLSTEELAHV